VHECALIIHWAKSEGVIAASTDIVSQSISIESYGASTDRMVCENALSKTKGGANPWDSVGARAWVVEAYRRDFSPDFCARLLGRKVQNTSSSVAKLAKYSNKKICDMGTTKQGAWETDEGQWIVWDETFQKYVTEAERRNISLRDCSKLTGIRFREGPQNVDKEQISDHDVCLEAIKIRVTNYSRKPYKRAYSWSEDSSAVANARARGLTPEACGILVVTNPRIARDNQEKQKKDEAESRRLQAEAERKVEQEQIRKAEAEKQQRLAQEQRRKLAEARKEHLAPLRKKNRHSFAVIIGNKNYIGRTPTVSYAHNDADAMKRFVLDRLAYREGNVIDLRDATRNEIATMFGNKDTHKGRLFNIIRAGKSDVTVFYSGHGVPGLDNRRPYLLPVDGDPNLAEITGYPVDVLYSNLAKLPARSITVYLDACFSGESEKGMLISATSGISVTPKIPKSKSWMTVITAAQGDQFASWDEKAKHGLFTKHLLEALNGKADTEDFGNSDGKVSLAEVRNYLDDEMTYQARFVWNRQQEASVRGQDDTVLASVFKMPKGLSDVASIEEMDATYVVLKSANLRAGPSTNTRVVGKLNASTSVNVTGKVIGKNWYRLNDGSFVFGSLIRANN